MKKNFLFGGITAILIIAVIWLYLPKTNKALGNVQIWGPTDIVGTKIGTTTTGVNFAVNAGVEGYSATSTYVATTTALTDVLIFTVKALAASSTAGVHFSILGSNDYKCDTATTTTIYDVITMKQINWFDIGSHVAGLAGSQTISTGTSTIVWENPAVAQGKDIVLTNVNYNCVALQVSGSSTVLWIQRHSKSSY